MVDPLGYTKAGTDALVAGAIAAQAVSDSARNVAQVAAAVGEASSATRARVNAALAAGSAFGVKKTVRLEGDFTISGALVIPSNTTLDATDATITLASGAASHMIENAAVATARTVTDLVTTAASATVTSATAAFASGDVGKAALVYLGDTAAPRHLATTIASVSNATTAVLADPIPVALAGTGASIGARDHDIKIVGGNWVRGINGIPPGDNTLHSLFFRRVDRLTIRSLSFGSGSGKYGISIADARNFLVQDFTLIQAPSDGVHLGGLCFKGTISRVKGSTGDDLAAITCDDYSIYNDVGGDVSDILFEDCILEDRTNLGATPNAVAIYSDNTTGHQVRRVTVNRCIDQATAAQRSVTVAGPVTDLVIQNCFGAIVLRDDQTSGSPLMAGVTIRDHSFTFLPGTNQAENALYISGVTIPNLLVDGLAFANLPTGGVSAWGIVVAPNTAITKLLVRRASRRCNRGGLIYVYGTGAHVDTIALEDCYSDGIDYSGSTRLVNADTGDAHVWTVILRGCTIARHSTTVSLTQSGATILTSACDFSDAVNLISGSGTYYDINSANTRWPAGAPSLSSGAVIHSHSFDLPIDVSKLAGSAGDMATNTSNANTGALGAGPVVHTGSAWKSIVSGATF